MPNYYKVNLKDKNGNLIYPNIHHSLNIDKSGTINNVSGIKMITTGGNFSNVLRITFLDNGMIDYVTGIRLKTKGTSWLAGTTSNAVIQGTQHNETSFYPLLRVKTFNNHFVVMGGIKDKFGFYGYYDGRTENGTDWIHDIDISTGALRHTKDATFGGKVTTSGQTTIDCDTGPQLTIDSTGSDAGIYLYRHSADTNISWLINNKSGILYFNEKTVTDTAYTTALSLASSGVTFGATMNVYFGNGSKYYINTDGIVNMNKLKVTATAGSAFSDPGIDFGVSRIGSNTDGGMGIYAGKDIYLRPSTGEPGVDYGYKFSTAALEPHATNTYNLGSSTLKWKNVYSTTFTGNLVGTADYATYGNSVKNELQPGNSGRFYAPFVPGYTNNAYYHIRTNLGITYYVENYGKVQLQLGTATASGSTNGYHGELKLYSESTGCGRLIAIATQTADVTLQLPSTAGRLTCSPTGSVRVFYCGTVSAWNSNYTNYPVGAIGFLY